MSDGKFFLTSVDYSKAFNLLNRNKFVVKTGEVIGEVRAILRPNWQQHHRVEKHHI